jgi:UPF0271 protein
MKVVLDTSALIYLQDFRKFDEIFIPPLVVEEVKDKLSSIKLASINAKVLEPSEENIRKIKDMAEKTGDLEKISKADIQVLALAKETKSSIISDDYNIQNIAKKMGLNYIPVLSKGIKEFFVWKKYCPSCKRHFKSELKECPVCGARLKRLPKTK